MRSLPKGGGVESHGEGDGAVLSKRALNRALLARQLLLRREAMPAMEAVRHLAGLQAQAPNPPYYALWARLAGFRQEELSQLLRDRGAVRIALMRSTIHLVTAGDCMAFRPLLQPMLERGMKSNHGKRLGGAGMDELAAAGRALVEAQPRTFNELGKRLHERWPDGEPESLAAAVRTAVPLVQVPPRGLWGASGQAAHTSAEAWLGRPLAADSTLVELVRRYLAAYGPATAKDAQAWSGLTRLGEVFERLRPSLLAFRDEQGDELFDLPDAQRPSADTLVPPRLLGEYDNILLSHEDRSRIMTEEHRKRVFTVNGIIRATVLIDGFVAGMWRLEKQRETAALTIELFDPEPLSERVRLALQEEAERLLDFAAPDAGSRSVVFR